MNTFITNIIIGSFFLLPITVMAQTELENLSNTGTIENSKNPFVKPSKAIPTNLPKGLPNDYNNVNFVPPPNNTIIQPETSQIRFEWYHMRVVGFINDNVLIRIEDPNSNNNNSNGGNNNNNNNNSNNVQPIVTLMVTLNERFFFNKEFYMMKKEKNFFVIYNKKNQAVHSMILESNVVQIIPKSGSQGGTGISNNQGATSVTR